MTRELFATMSAAGLAISLSTSVTSCKQEVTASQPTTTVSEPLKAAASDSKVARIIFVGKQNACDCTRKRVEAGWAALQRALGTRAKVPVLRLQIDAQGDEVAPYRKQQPMMALPAIYFIDAKAKVLDLLQGEVTDTQIAAALDR